MGVEITDLDDDLDGFFKKTYDIEESGYTGSLTLAVESDDEVVAPGTGGSLANITITGKPEVAVRVTYEAELTADNWLVESALYFPVEFSLDDGSSWLKIGNSSITTVQGLEDEINAQLLLKKEELEPNKDLSTDLVGFNIQWRWVFEGPAAVSGNPADGSGNTGITKTGGGTYTYDEADTYLGDWAERNPVAKPEITFKLTVTVTQID